MTCMLLLASASPRRRELMELTGWDVEICPVPVDEMAQVDEQAEALAIRLARTKARAAAAECPACELVLAADTVVVDGGTILGKLVDAIDAERMLLMLRDREHEVITALVFLQPANGEEIVETCKTVVHMRAYDNNALQAYVAGGGLPGLIAIAGPDHDDTLELALAYAHACGALKGGGFLSTFREEAVSDQFGEQVVLCGGLVELVTAAWETLVDRGHSPEVAYFECLHEVKLIVDLMHEHGLDGMRSRISTTAAWGGFQAGPKVIGAESRQAMGDILDRIEDGRFAREFLDVQEDGGAQLKSAIEAERSHPIVGTGHGLREFLRQCRLDQTSTESDPED